MGHPLDDRVKLIYIAVYAAKNPDFIEKLNDTN